MFFLITADKNGDYQATIDIGAGDIRFSIINNTLLQYECKR